MPTTPRDRPTREQIMAFKKDLAEVMRKHHYPWDYLKYEEFEIALKEASTDFIDSI